MHVEKKEMQLDMADMCENVESKGREGCFAISCNWKQKEHPIKLPGSESQTNKMKSVFIQHIIIHRTYQTLWETRMHTAPGEHQSNRWGTRQPGVLRMKV